MKTTKETRAVVCKMMHSLMAQGNMTKSEAMAMAWANVKLADALKRTICKFTFVKVDGTVKVAVGTLKPSMLPDKSHNAGDIDYNVQRYFDVKQQGWRCFKRINLVAA